MSERERDNAKTFKFNAVNHNYVIALNYSMDARWFVMMCACVKQFLLLIKTALQLAFDAMVVSDVGEKNKQLISRYFLGENVT